MSESSDQGIFINGKQQIIEMLQFMNEGEKQKLLQNIKARNAPMARELSEQSFSFKSLFNLSDDSIYRIFSRVNPAIVALAIYPLNISLQRKALGILDRSAAEQTFSIMQQNLSSKKQESKRAQNKIVQNAIQLSRQSYITI